MFCIFASLRHIQGIRNLLLGKDNRTHPNERILYRKKRFQRTYLHKNTVCSTSNWTRIFIYINNEGILAKFLTLKFLSEICEDIWLSVRMHRHMVVSTCVLWIILKSMEHNDVWTQLVNIWTYITFVGANRFHRNQSKYIQNIVTIVH